MKLTQNNNYIGNETHRMQQLHGLPLASFKRRAAAFIIDFTIASVLCLPILLFGGYFLARLGIIKQDLHLEIDFEHWYSIPFLVLYFALSIYYGNGQTLGKRLMGIKIVSVVHDKMSFWHSIERSLGYGASFLELGFGFFQYFLDVNRRTVHDRIAETIVIQVREPKT